MSHQIEDHTLMDFANAVVSHDSSSVMSLMAHLHSMAAPEAAHQTAALGDAVVSFLILSYSVTLLEYHFETWLEAIMKT